MTSRTRPQGSGHEDGFTLIELLVSLAILGMIAVMLLGGVTMAAQMTNRINQSRSADEDVIAAQNLLRNRIEHLRAVRRLDSSDPVIDVRGTPEMFSFSAPPADRLGAGGLQHYRLLRTATGDLILFSASNLSASTELDAPGIIGWTPTRLLSGVAGVSIAYFGPGASAGTKRWQTFWYDRPQPPELVRFHVTFADGDRRDWPDLVIRPRVTANPACTLDPLTGRCPEGDAG